MTSNKNNLNRKNYRHDSIGYANTPQFNDWHKSGVNCPTNCENTLINFNAGANAASIENPNNYNSVQSSFPDMLPSAFPGQNLNPYNNRFPGGSQVLSQLPNTMFPPPVPNSMPPFFNPPQFYPSINSVDFSVPPPLRSHSSSTDDCGERSVQRWLDSKPRLKTQLKFEKKESVPGKISISQYKEKISYLSAQMKELEKLTTHLQIMNKSLDETEWTLRTMEVVNQKEIVQEAIKDLKSIPMEEIKYLLNKRKKKRIRLKRKRQESKELRKERKAFCQLEHSRIDLWLDKMKDQVQRARREADIKKEADYVLSEVFHKKAEAKRMLHLLTTLGKLRNARIQDRQSKGEFVSQEAADTFNSIIEKLKRRWLNQMKGYNVEEQGLRVMLDDAQVQRSNVEEALNKQILNQWLTTLFGESGKHGSPYQPNSVQQLISLRRRWDQYVVGEDSLLGSGIPCGWVLPAPPSSNAWTKFLN